MKPLIMDRIVALLAEKPNLRIRDVVAELPDVDRSTISSTLHRLSVRGVIIRTPGINGRYLYRVATGPAIPLYSASSTVNSEEIKRLSSFPVVPMISQDEWASRYAAAMELKEKGLYRRCERCLLELLGVTAEVKLREQIIRQKTGIYSMKEWR